MGNQDSKTSKTPQAHNKKTIEDTQNQKLIQIQKAKLQLDRKIGFFDDKIKKNQFDIDKLKAKAKQLFQMQKKAQGRKYLEAAQKLIKQKQQVQVRKKVVQNQKHQLQMAQMDKITVNAMGTAQVHIKDTQKYGQKLTEMIEQSHMQKRIQEQINDKLKGLTQNQDIDDQVNDLMAQLEGQIRKQKKQKIAPKTVTTQVKQTNVQKQKQKQSQDDQIAKMMAEL